tara:strand:- start:95 stop:274 length:180 start_codon:yes stop_codon:yes gene_type:complete
VQKSPKQIARKVLWADTGADKENTQGAENKIEESPLETDSNLDKISSMSPSKVAGKKLR